MSFWRKRFLLLYMMRVPLLFFALLGFALPYAFGSSTFHGIADLPLSQVAWAALLAFLLVSSSITGCFLMLLYGEERADGWAERPAPQDRVTPWSVSVLYLYGGICYVVFLFSIYEFMKTAQGSAERPAREFLLFSSLGLLAGIAIVMIFFVGSLRLAKPEDDDALEVFAFPAFFVLRRIFGGDWIRDMKGGTRSEAKPGSYAAHDGPVSTFLAARLGPGYASPAAAGRPAMLHSGHRFSAIVILIFLVLYWISGKGTFWQLTSSQPWSPCGPPNSVLNFLLLFLIFWNCVLTAITFFVDRFRVPALAALATVLALISVLGTSDHLFLTVERNNAAAPLKTPSQAFWNIRDSVIVVAAAGGGIQSAAWTSRVLCGLRHDLPENLFQNKILAISAVSGGSVGTMFYLRCLDQTGEDDDDQLPAKWAQNSSLEAVAWGLTHPDLRRIFIPGPATRWSEADRGWALERSLFKSVNFGHPMKGLADQSSHPNWPIVLLNSTDALTGDPVVFTNSDYLTGEEQSSTGKHYLHDFHRLCPGRDVLLETAARISAAYPYVSPESRPDVCQSGTHLGDGGYFDNSGVFTLTEWLKEAVRSSNPAPAATPIAIKKILILQLDAFPTTERTASDNAQKWFYQSISPMLTMLRVRSEGQVIRDETAGQDLQKLLNASRYQTDWLLVRYTPPPAADESSTSCPSDPPLSWHLTAYERSCVDKAWNQVRGKTGQTIVKFMNSPVEAPSASCEIKPTRIVDGVFERQCLALPSPPKN